MTEQLSPEIEEQITKSIREGISLSLDRSEGKDKRHVTGIHWNPGDPNPLADIIIQYVQQPSMKLTLDGHHYIISPAE